MNNQESLFQELDTARFGDYRTHQNLIIPKLLQKASLKTSLKDKKYNRAYETILKWADLETQGSLLKRKETTLEPEFIPEIFSALGYIRFSNSLETWDFESQYFIDGGKADGVIGFLGKNKEPVIKAVLELKSPTVNLDRDRFGGRTAVQQCWDYLNNLPDCPWGIVCNYVSIRLYHRRRTPRTYQLFTLQDLHRPDIFAQFYYLFERGGLLASAPDRPARADLLLEESGEHQSKIGDELYQNYNYNRLRLIHHLTRPPHNKTMDNAIRIAQKILDRIIFIAFCEDRSLLPQHSLYVAYKQIPPFHRATNPRWRNFLDLFRSIDEGNSVNNVARYNGGLFQYDEEVDGLELDDDWTSFFNSVGEYDFRDEVNVEVLGHLFERSINDIEKIRLGGLFQLENEIETRAKMLKSAHRKREGIFYTPPELTAYIVKQTVGKLISERFSIIAAQYKLDNSQLMSQEPNEKIGKYWRDCYMALQEMRIVDPACGSGAFLIAAFDFLEAKYLDVLDQLSFHDKSINYRIIDQIPDLILEKNLFGVDLSQEAVEITQLALWIRSAQPGRILSDLSANIRLGNSLVSDPKVHPKALNWEETFPKIFQSASKGFDCVLGNPPWERLKLQEREFFDAASTEIASTVRAADRQRKIEELKKKNSELYEKYETEKKNAEQILKYIRESGEYPLTGIGDVNTYMVFAELAGKILSPGGYGGLLIPSGIATDHSTRIFFQDIVEKKRLVALYDFENRKKLFPDTDPRYKFSIFLFSGEEIQNETTDFVFFIHEMKDLEVRRRHIQLSPSDFALFNPSTKTCPVFRTKQDAEITRSIYRRIPILIDRTRTKGGNPWGIRFFTMFHQTNDSALFISKDYLKKEGYVREGQSWQKGESIYLPLYEGKMVQAYDHRAASIFIKDINWFRQGQKITTSVVEHINPEFSTHPRWWVEEKEVLRVLKGKMESAFLIFKSITSPTNRRTMIATYIPFSAVQNSIPIIFFDTSISARKRLCFLANLNCIALDYVARQKVGGVNLNFFIVEQLPIFLPTLFDHQCPWKKDETLENWISERVFKLTCTSEDMRPLGEEAGFDPPVHPWNDDERNDLIAQLDAAFLHLYGLSREEVQYIITTFQTLDSEDSSIFDLRSQEERILNFYDDISQSILY